jgi:hypothetical protein
LGAGAAAGAAAGFAAATAGLAAAGAAAGAVAFIAGACALRLDLVVAAGSVGAALEWGWMRMAGS